MTPREIATEFGQWAQEHCPEAALVLVARVGNDVTCMSNLPPPVIVLALEAALVQARQAVMKAKGPPS